MGQIRTGTVGYSYRDWLGIFYPVGSAPRRQLNLYQQNFDVCELTQFTHQMPDPERIAEMANQFKGRTKVFVRLHNAFTHCADVGLALTLAKHFRKATEPLVEAGRLAGLIAPFPYAFRNNEESREYVEQLAAVFRFEKDGELIPLQLDFRHPSWAVASGFQWMARHQLGFVCVDEPQLPGLVPAHVVSTAREVLVRLHGRNGESWWSGNSTTRHDYCYEPEELQGLMARYQPLIENPAINVSFIFQNNWQAQSVRNALQWKVLMLPKLAELNQERAQEAVHEDDLARPPLSLPLSEVKSRVSRALSGVQIPMQLPPRDL